MIKTVFFVLTFVFLVNMSPVYAGKYDPDWNYSGILEVIGDDHIIVNDKQYRVSAGMRYFSVSGKYVSKFDFKEGSSVALALDVAKREVHALWLIDAEVQ
jgi:hypothetical protein